MKVKIKPSEISELSDYVISKCSELDDTYKDINTLINSLSDIWIGNDSKEFIENAINDIVIEKNKNNNIKKFGENLKVISKDFQEQEVNWAEQIKRENLDNE